MTQEHYERLMNTLDRIAAECGCAWPSSANPKEMAAYLLACNDPPKGEDAAFCRAVIAGVE